MKKAKPFTRILALVLAVIMTGLVPVAAAETTTGWKIPSDNNVEIFVMNEISAMFTGDDAQKAFEAQVNMFAAEFLEKLGDKYTVTIKYQSKGGTVDANDIILVQDTDASAQGYSIANDTDGQVKIGASDKDGLFYGCRALIKQLILDEVVEDEAGSPDVLERAVSLDNGRRYFTVEWIKEFIREMSWANMNTLALHFSEEMGLGIESKLYPWLNGRDGTLCTQAEVATDNRYLTQEEIIDIVNYAKLYHVDIVPSLDSPGHMNYIVKKFNEKSAEGEFSFTYDGVTYTVPKGTNIGNYFSYNGETTAVVPGSRNGNYSRGIDISNEIAVAFTRSLISEYATLFAELGCTKFDIGGDELLGWGSAVVSTSIASRWQQLDHWKAYAQKRTGNDNAVAYDAFLLYMNDLNALVRELGYTSVRMWNDDALRSSDTGWTGVVELDTNIDIWFWTAGSNTVWTYATAGYQVYNILSDYNYYAMTQDYFAEGRGSFNQAYADQIYNEWTPYTFDPTSTTLGSGKNTALGNANILGGAFGVWCDNPVLRSDDEIMTDLLPLIRANAAKSWDALANETVSYGDFTANWDKLGSAPSATEYVAPVVVDYTELKAALAKAEELYKNIENGAYVNYIDDKDNKIAELAAAINEGTLAILVTEQSVVDAAAERLNEAYDAIFDYEMKTGENGAADETDYILSASFISSRVYVGKVATLNVTVQKDLEVLGFDITYTNEDGVEKHVPYFRFLKTNNKTKTIYRALFNPTEDHVESDTIQEYTIRVIFADGTVSNDSITKNLNVRG